MNIFKKHATWFALLGGNSALCLDSLFRADFTTAAINAGAAALCAVALSRTASSPSE